MKKLVRLLTFMLATALVCCSCSTTSENTPTETENESGETTLQTESEETEMELETQNPLDSEFFYVCLYTGNLEEGVLEKFDNIEDAEELCEKKRLYGYRVCNDDGNLVYTPDGMVELQCDILREGKWVADYVRENGFTYGDAPINPAIDCTAKKVSCDRLVGWIYYRVGFTEGQPTVQGLVVSNIFDWCEEMGFTRIDDIEDLEPGDIVGIRPQANNKYPGHVFIYAGESTTDGYYRTYDGGSDYRIQYNQPCNEPKDYDTFMCAYRAVSNHSGSIAKLESSANAKDMPVGLAAKFASALSDITWGEPYANAEYTYIITVDGEKYVYDAVRGIISKTDLSQCGRISGTKKNSIAEAIEQLFG